MVSGVPVFDLEWDYPSDSSGLHTGMYQLAVLLCLTRAGMREVLTEEYIKTAWAKGLPPMKAIFKRALNHPWE